MVKVVGYWLVFSSWSDLKTIVHALNYLLAQETWASDLLQKQKNKTIKLVLPVVEMSLKVTDQGHFALEEKPSGEPNVTLTIGADVFNAYIAGGKEAAVKHVKVSGDVDLAQAVSTLAGQLRWEAEEDLSKLVGDPMAHRIMQTAKQSKQFSQNVLQDVGTSVLEYLIHEKPTLVKREELVRYKDEIRRLRDDIERIEKRVERLQERLL
jgi:ubiquinone biosynthesis accessory factor UbiJ